MCIVNLELSCLLSSVCSLHFLCLTRHWEWATPVWPTLVFSYIESSLNYLKSLFCCCPSPLVTLHCACYVSVWPAFGIAGAGGQAMTSSPLLFSFFPNSSKNGNETAGMLEVKWMSKPVLIIVQTILIQHNFNQAQSLVSQVSHVPSLPTLPYVINDYLLLNRRLFRRPH